MSTSRASRVASRSPTAGVFAWLIARTASRSAGSERSGRHPLYWSRSWVLEHLAGGVARQDVDDLELLGQLLDHQPGAAQVGDHLVEGQRQRGIGELHDGADPLARVRIGHADDGDVGHLGVRVEEVLHLLGRDVLTLADDDVLEPTGDDEVAALVEPTQVAGAEEAVLVEGVGVERRVRGSRASSAAPSPGSRPPRPEPPRARPA